MHVVALVRGCKDRYLLFFYLILKISSLKSPKFFCENPLRCMVFRLPFWLTMYDCLSPDWPPCVCGLLRCVGEWRSNVILTHFSRWTALDTRHVTPTRNINWNSHRSLHPPPGVVILHHQVTLAAGGLLSTTRSPWQQGRLFSTTGPNLNRKLQ